MSFDSTSRLPAVQQPANSGSVEAGHGRRLYERFPIDTQLQICWEEAEGAHRQIRARAIVKGGQNDRESFTMSPRAPLLI